MTRAQMGVPIVGTKVVFREQTHIAYKLSWRGPLRLIKKKKKKTLPFEGV
jgi:hypothetical protein